ncbi:MAG TPA: carboxypeptidase-like regulatory domain-containing protein, partial [Pyrinomonadaceae bacterium]
MKRIIAPLIFLLCVGISYSQETKLCKTVQKDETTCWGWIQGHTAVNGGTVKKIRGKVVDPTGEPVIDALIEVFDNPDLDFDKRKRIAACRTDKNGEFSFEGLAADKYELRGSYCRG